MQLPDAHEQLSLEQVEQPPMLTVVVGAWKAGIVFALVVVVNEVVIADEESKNTSRASDESLYVLSGPLKQKNDI